MATFTSPRYRSLLVKFADGTRVRFDNGTAEVEGDTAVRLADFAKRNPGYDIAHEGEVKPSEPKPGSKAHLQSVARGLDLDDSGTKAELEARIEAALAEEPEDDDEDDDEEPERGSDDDE